jgi:hypothetical protein
MEKVCAQRMKEFTCNGHKNAGTKIREVQVPRSENSRYQIWKSLDIKNGEVVLPRMKKSKYYGCLNLGTKNSKFPVPAMLNSRYHTTKVRARRWKTPFIKIL